MTKVNEVPAKGNYSPAIVNLINMQAQQYVKSNPLSNLQIVKEEMYQLIGRIKNDISFDIVKTELFKYGYMFVTPQKSQYKNELEWKKVDPDAYKEAKRRGMLPALRDTFSWTI